MTGLWIATAAVTAFAVVLVVLPLLRRGAAPIERAAYDRAVWKDQLAEIDRDVARGVLLQDEAEAARVEIKRRILSVSGQQPDRSSGASHASRRSPALAAALVVSVSVLAFGVYTYLGTPEAPDQPLAARTPAPSEQVAAGGDQPPASLNEAVESLRARLAEQPGDIEGWILLGRTSMTMNRPTEAVDAFARALVIDGDRFDVAALYGEAAAVAAGGRISPEAREAFETSLAGDPRNPRARYYMGMARYQDGDIAGALQEWIDLKALSPDDAPWMPAVNQQIERAAAEGGLDPDAVQPSPAIANIEPIRPAPPAAAPSRGPSREDMEAAAEMSEEERDAMIRGMVQQLADRLEREPDDLEGWRALAQAWTVLGEPDKAAAAAARAEALEGR